jgi:hypothetical protein
MAALGAAWQAFSAALEVRTAARYDAGKEGSTMATVATPVELVESVAELRLPPKADARLQALMDRNTAGLLTPQEREDLEALVELSERIGLLRAEALLVLGRRPA